MTAIASPDALPRLKTILYATNLGDHMRPVFRQALSLANAYDANIIMLHVIEPLGATGSAVLASYLPGVDAEQVEKEHMKKILSTMQERIHTFCISELGQDYEDGKIVEDIVVCVGAPDEEILYQAEKREVDLIVLGTGLHKTFGSPTLGSTVRRVTRHTKVPVFLVPNEHH